jgi:outer membrane protein OmpA-like peptidoglycan-associated protein
VVEGHTDNKGKAAYNRKLSDKRAASVVKWLVEHGVSKARLRSRGIGMERPIATNEDEVGRQTNRRVEFHIEGKDASLEKDAPTQGGAADTPDDESDEDDPLGL